MAESETFLETEDYEFLERFLDATKSNLFFAKGLIFVEGDAENLLLPAFADLIGYPLHEYGISIVNIGNTAFERYIKLFSRNGEDRIVLPISIVTDVDIRPLEYYNDKCKSEKVYVIENQQEFQQIVDELKLESNLSDENRPYGKIFSTIKKLIYGFDFKSVSDEEQLENKVVKDLTEEYFKRLTTMKSDGIIKKYKACNANSKTFVAPEWTLEYSLAKSPLVQLLWKSIHETRYTSPNSPANIAKFHAINNQIITSDEVTSQLAYKIFKPLNDRDVSKAIVAQKLAVEIEKLENEEKETLRTKILSNYYTRYLVNAIKHAAQITVDEEVLTGD